MSTEITAILMVFTINDTRCEITVWDPDIAIKLLFAYSTGQYKPQNKQTVVMPESVESKKKFASKKIVKKILSPKKRVKKTPVPKVKIEANKSDKSVPPKLRRMVKKDTFRRKKDGSKGITERVYDVIMDTGGLDRSDILFNLRILDKQLGAPIQKLNRLKLIQIPSRGYYEPFGVPSKKLVVESNNGLTDLAKTLMALRLGGEEILITNSDSRKGGVVFDLIREPTPFEDICRAMDKPKTWVRGWLGTFVQQGIANEIKPNIYVRSRTIN